MQVLSIKLYASILALLLSNPVVAQIQHSFKELPNFRVVDEKLYRGAQPKKGGLEHLARLGVNTIINLRGSSERTRAEEAEAASLGLRYFNVPLPGWGRPSDSEVRRIMNIIAEPESVRVFIHCKDGVDRTGMIVAIYRMTEQGWTSFEATREARELGMRRIQFWKRDYIDDYYSSLVDAPQSATGTQAVGEETGLDDKIGLGISITEREAFKARRVAKRFLRATPSGLNNLLDRIL